MRIQWKCGQKKVIRYFGKSNFRVMEMAGIRVERVQVGTGRKEVVNNCRRVNFLNSQQ